jgi:preprotein translocase subunit SecG
MPDRFLKVFMNGLFSLLLAIHVMVALCIIGLVLMQHGKGADMGAAFGSGASGSLFGASGSANFFSHATAVLAAVFFLTSLSLGYMAASAPKMSGGSIMQGVVQSAPSDVPAELPAEVPGAVDQTPSGEKEVPR